LGLAPIGPFPDDVNEPQRLGESELFDETSPEHCSQVMASLDSLARSGVGRVSCFSTEPIAGDEDAEEEASAAALPETSCSGMEKNVYWQSRRWLCIEHQYFHYVINPQTGGQVGRASFLIQQELTLRDVQSTPLTVGEFVAVSLRDQRGEATNMSMTFDSGCSGCSTASGSPWEGRASFSEGQTRQDQWNWTIPINAGGLERPNWGWQLRSYSGSLPTTEPYEWGGGIAIVRCDNQVGGDYGCVMPTYRPTLTLDYAVEQAGGMLVAVGYQLNNHWWGSQEKNKPLTRQANDGAANDNRDIICPDDFEPDLNVTNPSCDEYPFARTWESRDNSTIYNGDHCQQLTSRQYPNGDWDLFPVGTWDANAPCLRATTPLGQNQSVGGELGRFTTRNRLLDRDPYYTLLYDSRVQPE
jgi:hypothetical protein